MFPPSVRLLVVAIDIVLLLSGFVLLWRHGLSSTARQQPVRLARWEQRPSDFLLFLWLAIVIALLTQFAAGALVGRTALTLTQKTVIAGGALHVGLLAGVLLHRFQFDRDRAFLRFDGAAWRAGVATFLIVLPVIAVVSLIWQNLLLWLGFPVEQQELVEMFTHADSPWLVVGMAGLAVLVAPLSEESLFRAGIFRYLHTRGPTWIALVVPALLFGALHMNLATFVPLAALGVVFSLAYRRTGNAAVTMIAHGLFNLNTVLLVLAGVNT